MSARSPLGTAYAAALLDLHGVTTHKDLAPLVGLTPQALSPRPSSTLDVREEHR